MKIIYNKKILSQKIKNKFLNLFSKIRLMRKIKTKFLFRNRITLTLKIGNQIQKNMMKQFKITSYKGK